MRRVLNSSVRGVAAVAVILALAGSASAVTREGRERGRNRESFVMKVIKKIVRGLGDGLIIPIP
jgi:hypothetical protein